MIECILGKWIVSLLVIAGVLLWVKLSPGGR